MSNDIDSPEYKSAIDKYLRENLPECENRISSPICRTCEVIVVIPVYGELNYFLYTLKSLAFQKKISKDKYEVIVVVNNPSSIPEKVAYETDEHYQSRLSHYSQALIENQKTIHILKYLNNECTSSPLDGKLQQLINELKNSGLKVYLIDKASENKTLIDEEANVGGARNRGTAEAIERFYLQLKKNGIIAHTDADAQVDEYYIYNLNKVFNNKKIIAASGILQFYPEKIDYEYYLTERYKHLVNKYQAVFYYLFPREYKTFFPFNRTYKEVFSFSAPSMASRAFETALAGGIPKHGEHEAHLFAYNICKIGLIKKTSKIKIKVLNRLSCRVSTNKSEGHGNTAMRFNSEIKIKGAPEVESFKMKRTYNTIKSKLIDCLINGNITHEYLRSLLTINNKSLVNEDEIDLLVNKLNSLSDFEKLTLQTSDLYLLNIIKKNLTYLYPNFSVFEGITNLKTSIPIDILKYERIKKKLYEDYNASYLKKMSIIKKLIENYDSLNDKEEISFKDFANKKTERFEKDSFFYELIEFAEILRTNSRLESQSYYDFITDIESVYNPTSLLAQNTIDLNTIYHYLFTSSVLNKITGRINKTMSYILK